MTARLPAVDMAHLVEEARRCQPVSCGRQVRAMRELAGLSQADLAGAVGISAAALSQAEHGRTRLSQRSLVAVAALLEAPMESLIVRPDPEMQLLPQLRQPRRVRASSQRRATQVAAAAVRLRAALTDWVCLPEVWQLNHPIDAAAPAEDVAGDIETAATHTRRALGADDSEPLGSLMRPLAAAGIVVARDPDADPTVGAYSAIIDSQPVIVTGTSGSWDRDNFDLAHELGHIVMHRGSCHRHGQRAAERQARRFAAALLAPPPLLTGAPLTGPGWRDCLVLKQRLWMPMAEIIEWAHALSLITRHEYGRFMRYRSARGWTRQEPGNDLHPRPAGEPLRRAARLADVGVDEMTERALLPRGVVSMLCQGPAVDTFS